MQYSVEYIIYVESESEPLTGIYEDYVSVEELKKDTDNAISEIIRNNDAFDIKKGDALDIKMIISVHSDHEYFDSDEFEFIYNG